MEKDIAIVILNYIQFINIKPGIDTLIKLGYKIDIISPIDKENDTTGFQDMFTNINKYLKDQKYNVLDNKPDFEYKVLLEPYPCLDIKSKYKIRYRYGILSAKPNLVYIPENFIKYDGVICSAKYEANYLSNFSKIHLMGNMKYAKFQRKNHDGKPILLYLPTYGDECSIDDIINSLNNLRKKYYIIAKVHHGTTFLKNEKYRVSLLKDNVDEFYDLYKELSSLLEIADVVLTDNSGALFDSLYVNVPVAIYADDINKNKLENFDTVQYELVNNGIVPYTNKANEINKIIKRACTKQVNDLQINWSRENLYYSKNVINDFVKIIEDYLSDNINIRYYEMHNILRNRYYNNLDKISRQEEVIKDLQNKNRELLLTISQEKETAIKEKETAIKEKETAIKEKETAVKEKKVLLTELNYYRTGKLYKIANKIYKIKNGGK